METKERLLPDESNVNSQPSLGNKTRLAEQNKETLKK